MKSEASLQWFHHVILGLILGLMIITPISGKHDLTECGHKFEKPIGQIEYKANLNVSTKCDFYIQLTNKSTTDGLNLFVETLTLLENDTLKIFMSNTSTEPLFEFSTSINSFTPLFTSEKETLFLQLETSAIKGAREVRIAYLSQSCVLNIPLDMVSIAAPIYDKKVTSPRPCQLLFGGDQHRNFSYAFTFEKVNITSKSQIEFENIEPQVNIQGPVVKAPFDLFGQKKAGQPTIKMTFDVDTSKDQLFIRVEKLIKECSLYDEVLGVEEIHSPQIGDIPDGVDGLCRWFFGTKTGALGVKFKSVNFTDKLDIAAVSDGGYSGSSPFYQVTSLTESEALTRQIRTSSSMVMISFKPVSFMKSNLSFSVFIDEQGKYMRGNGSIGDSGPAMHSVDGSISLLEVEKDQNVLLNFIGSSMSGSAVLKVYDDFSTISNEIASLTGNIWYPILSTTSRMMIQAVNFEKGHFFNANFNGTAAGCMHMTPGKSDNYILSGNCDTVCAWIIPPVDSRQELQLELQYIALEPSDTIRVLQLDKSKTVLATVTNGTSHLPTLSLDPKVGAYVEVSREKCEKPKDVVLVAQVSYLPECSKNYSLVPYNEIVLTSPNYPNTYPLYDICLYGITSASANMYTYLSFKQLQLASDHCINIRQKFKNGTEQAFQVNGMPDDIIFQGQTVVEFNSKKCNSTKVIKGVNSLTSDQGFVMNVMSSDCGGLLQSKTGTLESVPDKKLCIWKISVSPTESDGSVNIILFTVKRNNDTGNYNLTVYDGGSARSNKLANLTGDELWSRTNSLVIMYEVLDLSKPASHIVIDYHTLSCNKSMQCQNKICMHPDWRCDGKNDCGDFSDERSCASVPAPPGGGGDEKTSGISGVVFGICIVVFFLLGLLVAIVVPKALDKIRNGRYSQFRDVSVVE